MQKKDFKFYTQYNQFYLTSIGNDFDPPNDDINSMQEDMDKRLGIYNKALAIFTQSYGDVKGEIEILLEKPVNEIDYKKYDHIVEGGINVQSGKLQILSWPGNEVETSLIVIPGNYRVRVYSSNLASVKETDLAHDTDNDYYRIEVWPSDDMERKVLKQYKGD